VNFFLSILFIEKGI